MKNSIQSKSVANNFEKGLKPQRPMILVSCVGAVACLLLAASAQAATTYYWDGNGSGASGITTGLGGDGTWDTTSLKWWDGSSAYSTWPNTGGAAGSVADFRGTAGTVTIAPGGVTVGDSSNGAVYVGTSGYKLTGGALNYNGAGGSVDRSIYHVKPAGSFALDSATVISTYNSTGNTNLNFAVLDAAGAVMTVNGNIGLASTETAGTKSFSFNGGMGCSFLLNGTITDYAAGGSGAKLGLSTADSGYNLQLTLAGVNTYSGGTQIRGATVTAMNSSAVGTGDIGFSTRHGAFLTGAPVTISNNIVINAYAASAGVTLGAACAGVSNFTGTIKRNNATSADPLALKAVTGGTANFSGQITDNSTGKLLAITKTDKGVVNLSYAQGSNYGGGTNITDGTLLVNNTAGSATGTGAVKVNSVAASSASYSGASYRSYSYTVADTTGLVVGQSVTGTNIAADTYIVSIDSGTQLTLSTAPINGVYTGTLNFGAVAGTLGGTGIIAGVTTVSSGATIAPGNFSDGTLTLQTGLDLQGSYAWEINANSESAGFDKITLGGGNLTLGAGSTLNISALAGVDFSNAFWTTNHSWTVVDNTGSGTLTGAFGSLSGLVSNAKGSFVLEYGTGAGADAVLTWQAVPEPSTWAMIVGGMGMLAFGQKMRRRGQRLN